MHVFATTNLWENGLKASEVEMSCSHTGTAGIRNRNEFLIIELMFQWHGAWVISKADF